MATSPRLDQGSALIGGGGLRVGRPVFSLDAAFDLASRRVLRWLHLRYVLGGKCRVAKGWTMAEFTGRSLHLLKKALTIAVLAIERQPGPFQSSSDQADMKALLDALIENDTELAFYVRSARIAVTGEPD